MRYPWALLLLVWKGSGMKGDEGALYAEVHSLREAITEMDFVAIAKHTVWNQPCAELWTKEIAAIGVFCVLPLLFSSVSFSKQNTMDVVVDWVKIYFKIQLSHSYESCLKYILFYLFCWQVWGSSWMLRYSFPLLTCTSLFLLTLCLSIVFSHCS